VSVVPREMFVLFECVENNRAELRPAGMRRLTAAQRMLSGGHMRKFAASRRAGLIDHAEVAIQENARVPGIPQDSQRRRIAIRHGIETRDFLGRGANVVRDVFDFRFVHGYLGIPAAIRTRRTVHVLLYFFRQDLKLLIDAMVRGEVSAKGKVLFRLCGSEPINLSQIGNHYFRLCPRNGERNTQRQVRCLGSVKK